MRKIRYVCVTLLLVGMAINSIIHNYFTYDARYINMRWNQDIEYLESISDGKIILPEQPLLIISKYVSLETKISFFYTAETLIDYARLEALLNGKSFEPIYYAEYKGTNQQIQNMTTLCDNYHDSINKCVEIITNANDFVTMESSKKQVLVKELKSKIGALDIPWKQYSSDIENETNTLFWISKIKYVLIILFCGYTYMWLTYKSNMKYLLKKKVI